MWSLRCHLWIVGLEFESFEFACVVGEGSAQFSGRGSLPSQGPLGETPTACPCVFTAVPSLCRRGEDPAAKKIRGSVKAQTGNQREDPGGGLVLRARIHIVSWSGCKSRKGCVCVCVFSELLRGNARTLHRASARKPTYGLYCHSVCVPGYRIQGGCPHLHTQLHTKHPQLAVEPGPFTTAGHKEPNTHLVSLHVVAFTDFTFNRVKWKEKKQPL